MFFINTYLHLVRKCRHFIFSYYRVGNKYYGLLYLQSLFSYQKNIIPKVLKFDRHLFINEFYSLLKKSLLWPCLSYSNIKVTCCSCNEKREQEILHSVWIQMKVAKQSITGKDLSMCWPLINVRHSYMPRALSWKSGDPGPWLHDLSDLSRVLGFYTGVDLGPCDFKYV